jgi:hypothetical protein
MRGVAVVVVVVTTLYVPTGQGVTPLALWPAAPSTVAQGALDGAGGDLSPEEQSEADDLAEATIKRVCLRCHPVDVVARTRREATDWRAVVARMATLGAVATPEELRTIRRYLTRYYGVIRVNSASAEEFSAVLGYSPRDAAAIVAHRAAQGRFANVEALAGVVGLDRTRLDAQPEALTFD